MLTLHTLQPSLRGDGFGIHRGIGEESVSQRRPTDDLHQQKRLTAYGRV